MSRPPLSTSHPLRAWCVRHEISIVMLPEAAKLSTASISRIERGQQQPRGAAIRRLIEISAGALLDLRQGDEKTGTARA